MAGFEWGALANSLDANPVPTLYASGLTLPALVAGAENTALNFEYFGYDRMKFAARAGVSFPNQYGAKAWQQDDIHELGPVSWSVAHTVTSMSSNLDFGVHTGLHKFYGNDRKAYLGGFYRGAVANETGAVIWDYETGAYTSWVTNLGHASFSACTYAVPFRGKLLLATEGRIYSLDPAAKRLKSFSTGKTVDPTDKLFVLGGRLFLAGRDGGQMSVWEVGGGGAFITGKQVLTAFPRTSGGDFAVLNDYQRAGIVWKGNLITGGTGGFTFDTYMRYYYIDVSSTDFLSGFTVTDNTLPNEGSLTGGVAPLNSARVLGAHDAEPNFFSQDSQPTFLYLPGSAATASLHPQRRSGNFSLLNPVSGTLGGTGIPTSGDATHPSSRYGGQDDVRAQQEKSEDFKIEAHPTVAGALRIHYYGHTASGGGVIQSVRVYYRPRAAATLADALGTPFPGTAGTIIGTSSGTINANNKQADGVAYSTTGTTNYIDWDRVADLGASYNPDTPFRLVSDFAGSLPAP